VRLRLNNAKFSKKKLAAFERFVNLNAIALGVLQILALELPKSVWCYCPQWFRTLLEHGYLTEQIVRLATQHLQPLIFSKSRPTLLLPQLLADEIESFTSLDRLDWVA
jgi:hypothetical protein